MKAEYPNLSKVDCSVNIRAAVYLREVEVFCFRIRAVAYLRGVRVFRLRVHAAAYLRQNTLSPHK